MKTSSSKSLRALLWLAALAVLATTGWLVIRSCRPHQQAAETVAAVPAPRHQQQDRAKVLLSKACPLETIEGMPELREIWTGPTDPDSVWRSQMKQADKTLTQHHLPALNGTSGPPSTRRFQTR
ncbi:hypothetical protein [Prosthecobacter sp.]|uniref:hypothetical protein n=1 Tax=Prosthecobacter sp. TaxID=1965333 RepID=UPI0037836EA8